MQHSKHLHIWLVLLMALTIGVFVYAWSWVNEGARTQAELGITYSWVYAQELGLDPVEAFASIVGELDVTLIRLPIYWSDVEAQPGVFDWRVADGLMEIAEENDLALTVVVGAKVPRWPECHIPDWARDLDETPQQAATVSFITEAVERYKGLGSVHRWQVENEPYFPFGDCPTISVAQVKERVDTVRSLSDRPVQMTVSGELGPWLESAQSADILGISLYRQTYSDVFGYFVYPLSPDYYYFRAKLLEDHVERVVISELQAEPWFPAPIDSKPLVEWYEYFTQEQLTENVAFAKSVGLSEVYLWGAEWWYALAQEGDSRLWDTAKSLL